MPITVVVLLTLAGCPTPGPKDAFNQTAQAGEADDRDAFLEGFTAESRPLIALLIHHREHSQKMTRLGFGRKARAITANIQGDGVMAIVDIEVKEGGSPELGRIFMRLEDGRWRIDLVSTELLWNRQWDLSGGKPRGLPDWNDPDDPGRLDRPE